MKYPFLPTYAVPKHEKFFFPFSPIHAVRHWKKGTLGHRVIAVLMHIPVVGPLFALIERTAFLAQRHMQKKDPVPVPTPLPLKEKKVVKQEESDKVPDQPAGTGNQETPAGGPVFAEKETQTTTTLETNEIGTETEPLPEPKPCLHEHLLTEEEQQLEREREHFRKLYRDLEEKIKRGETPVYVEDLEITDEEVNFTEEEQKTINAVYRYYSQNKTLDFNKVTLITKKEKNMSEQDQLVFCLKSRPTLILKFGWNERKLRTKEEIEQRIQIAEKAKQRCKSEQDPLYLLNVPAQRVAFVPVKNTTGKKTSERFFMVQRKKKLYCSGDFFAQEGRLRWLSKEFPKVHQELLRQVHVIAQHLQWVDTAPVNFPASQTTIDHHLIDLTADRVTYVDKCGMNVGSVRKSYGAYASIQEVANLFLDRNQFYEYDQFMELLEIRESYKKKHQELLASDAIKIPTASSDERKEYKEFIEMVWKAPLPITKSRSSSFSKVFEDLNVTPKKLSTQEKSLPVMEVTIPWLMKALVCNDTQKSLYLAYYQQSEQSTKGDQSLDERQKKAIEFIEKLKNCDENDKKLFKYFLNTFSMRKATLDELTGRTVELEIPLSWKMNEKKIEESLKKLKGDYSFLNYQIKETKDAPIVVVWYF